MTSPNASLHAWNDIPREILNEKLARKVISGEKTMIAQIFLDAGCIVPRHSHPNEQVSHVLKGALRFLIGEQQDEEIIVRSGEVLVIPSDLPHSAEALNDTLVVDTFCPPRADWLDGSDSYLRKGTGQT